MKIKTKVCNKREEVYFCYESWDGGVATGVYDDPDLVEYHGDIYLTCRMKLCGINQTIMFREMLITEKPTFSTIKNFIKSCYEAIYEDFV